MIYCLIYVVGFLVTLMVCCYCDDWKFPVSGSLLSLIWPMSLPIMLFAAILFGLRYIREEQ